MGERVHLDFVALHFSTRCEASCTFCYASDSLVEKQLPTSIADIKKVLEKLHSESVTEVLFVGGDPVIHPSFIDSLEIAKSLGLKTSVLSNSWAIKPESRFLHALSLIDLCEATILGASAATHDAITRREGSFSKLTKNLQLIGDTGRSIGICTNAMPQNLDQIFEMVSYFVEVLKVPVHSLMIQRIIPSGAAAGNFKFGLNLDDVARLMRQIDLVNTKYGIPIHFEDPVPWCTVEEKFHKYLARCEWGYTRGSVSATGMMSRCGADDSYRLGSIWDGNVQDKWKAHPVLKSFRSKIYLPAECQSCALLAKCGGGCPLSCGTFKDHDLDQLYIQRKQAESVGEYCTDAPSGKGFENTTVRFAYEGDLEKIVELERRIFPDTAPLFKTNKIRELFSWCPKAFRVACKGERLLGYSVIYPLTKSGVNTMNTSPRKSILQLNTEDLEQRFSMHVQGLFIEVIATTTDCPSPVRYSLIKDLLGIMRDGDYPIFACVITSVGTSMVKKLGFTPVDVGLGIYRKDSKVGLLQ